MHPMIIYDDREWVADRLSRYTGVRRYGSLHVRGRSVTEHFVSALPDWARHRLTIIEPGANLESISSTLPSMRRGSGVLMMAARGAVLDSYALQQIIMRVPYSDRAVVDRRRHALFRYFPTIEALQDRWNEFRTAPLHKTDGADEVAVELAGETPLLDIGELPSLLQFIAGSTTARAFNDVSFDALTYRKRSANKAKIKAEHDYYSLIPTSMKPWMVGAYDYREDADGAEYKMLRYRFADAAFQWAHNAWSSEDFSEFLSRSLQFLSSRPSRPARRDQLEAVAESLFITKVRERWEQLLGSATGAQIIRGLSNSPGGERVVGAYEDYLSLVRANWRRVSAGEMVIGHGDPCLSNILYDPVTSTMKLIDPKGATTEDQLWTHSLYDYCKLSHSILGDYDYINNMLFEVKLNERAEHELALKQTAPNEFKREFEHRVSKTQDLLAIRLGEASLFLSMLPLHLDHPKKVVAFLLRARSILDGAKALA